MLKKGAYIVCILALFESAIAAAADANSIRWLGVVENVNSAIDSARSGRGEELEGILPQAEGWLLVQLNNPDSTILHLPSNSVASYSVYSSETGLLLESFQTPETEENNIEWNPKFTLSLHRSWGDEFLLQVSVRTQSTAPYSLLSFDEYQRLSSGQLVASGVFYGAIGLMALFSFALYVITRNTYAGLLSFSFVVWLLTMLSTWGFGLAPMPFGLSDFLPQISNKLTILGTLAGASFTSYFLRNIIKGSKSYRALNLGIALQSLFFLFAFLIDPPWPLILLVNIVAGILSLACASLAIARGDRAARFLLVSSALISSPFFFIFISPFSQQTIILTGGISLVMVMLALLTRQAEEAKNLEMKAELAVERERFLTSLSHEIRTPLNGIIGFSDLVNKEELEGKVKTYLGLIDRSSKVLLQIVNDVLDYAKLQETDVKLDFAPLNIVQTLNDVITINQPAASENNVHLELEIDESLPDYVTTDPQRCLQILINLCSNAVKFTENGIVNISAARENELLVFKVTDNGIGIQEDVLAGLFNPFQQADASTARTFGGTGLGLAISKQLCELLGGSLSAESEFGSGSTFTLAIPYLAASAPKEQEEVNPAGLVGKSVLVAEDNKVNLLLAIKVLEKLGLQTDSAEDGDIALKKAASNDYDFILMDMQMPKLSGIEVTEGIRKLGITTPIIAMTANTSESDREACYGAGMDDYLSKPMDQSVLMNKLVLLGSVENSSKS